MFMFVILLLTIDPKRKLGQAGAYVPVNYCPPKCLCESSEKIDCNDASFQTLPEILSGSLKHIIIRNSRLTILKSDDFKRFTSIETIILDNNDIQQIERYAFRGLKHLKYLQVQRNRHLNTLHQYSFGEIRSERHPKIFLRGNGIENIDPFAFFGSAGVRILDLRDNPTSTIHRFAFSGLHRVDFLYLPDRLTTIESRAFANLSGVHYLQVSGWRASDGVRPSTFAAAGRVRVLAVRRSALAVVRPLAFARLHTVGQIEIQDGSIGRLRRRAFAGLRNVGGVHIVNNTIGRLDRGLFNYTEGVPVNFRMNRLDCSCRTMWLLDGRVFVPARASLLRNNFCDAPSELEHLALADIPDTYLERCRAEQDSPDYYFYDEHNSSSVTLPTIAYYFFVSLVLLSFYRK